MKALKSTIFPLVAGLISLMATAQEPVPAGFEVDGDLYTSSRAEGGDDWFYREDRRAVLSLDSLSVFKDHIDKQRNISFYSGMSFPDMSVIDGKIWYTANFGHDVLATDADANPKSEDSSRFAPWNFTEDPRDWTVIEGYLENWVDLTDSYVHLRRDGIESNDSLFILGGLSALSTKRGRFIDMELYATDLELDGNSFVNTGQEDGHTAWQFDAAGKVLIAGDVDLGFAAENGQVIRTEIYIWVSREDYQANHGFDYEQFRPAYKNSAYGYARIATNPEMAIEANDAQTTTPPWGTHDRKLKVLSKYKNRQFFEFGLNLTHLGLDPAHFALDSNPCELPWKKMLVKSRKTTDIGAFLEDFAGPYPLFDRPVEAAAAGTISDAAHFDSCNTGETISLSALNQDPGYIYTWRSLDPGVNFPGGTNTVSGPDLFEVDIKSPGTYELVIRPNTYCGAPGTAGTITVHSKPCAMPDWAEVDYESSIVILPGMNDHDLEDDLDYQSVTASGLPGPDHGTIAIADTGEITYTPDMGYSGPDAFEYRICDQHGLCDTARVELQVNPTDPPPTIDSDGDGIQDSQDLDDDNDGIPDHLEAQILSAGEQPDCSGEFSLDFSQPATLESGTHKEIGAIYRIPDISTGVDALVSITEIHNATINAIDRNNEAAHAFRPSTSFEFSEDGEQAMVEYTIRFVEKDTYVPVVLGVLFMNFNDIDGTENYGEQSWAFNPKSYVVSDPTELSMDGEGQWVIGTAGTTDYDGATNQNPQVNFGISFASRSEVKVRVGVISRKEGVQSTSRQHNIEFQCVTNYVNPMHVSLDADHDGVANHLDLDSDNDGIYDAVEAGHLNTHVDGVLPGGYGTNGLADSVEDTADTGILNYTLKDTSASGTPDFMDTDSDEDGCSDANEAYADQSADGGDNDYYGLGSPPPVDEHGVLHYASYDLPADSNENGVADHLELPEDLLLQQPVDQTSCPGNQVIFQAEVSPNAIVSWEEEINGSWQEIAEDERIQGRQSAKLQIVALNQTDNGRRFRLALSAPGQVCFEYSEPVILSVNSIPDVQAQATDTQINAGEWVTLTGSGATHYSWNQGVTDGEAVQLYKTTTFTVTGWDDGGCPATDEITVEVNTLTDLALEMEADNSMPNVGDEFNIDLTLSNDGPNRATSIQVAIVIPDGILLESYGNGATLSGNLLIWEIDSLGIDSTQLSLSATVLQPQGTLDEYLWVAQVVYSEQEDADSTPANFENAPKEDDEAMLDMPVPQSELSILKSIDKEIVAVRDTVQFRIEITNGGPFTATAIEVDERLPSGYDWLWAETDRGTYNPVTALWRIDSLEVNNKATLDLFARVNPTEDYLNSASILQALQWEQDSTDNTSSRGVIEVYKEADLSLEKLADTSQAEVGDTINFSLRLTNEGPDHATHVKIEDRIPQGYTIESAGQGAVINGKLLNWEIENLPPGDILLTYVLRVNPPTGTPGEYLNKALVTRSRQDDPDSEADELWSGNEDDESSWEISVPPADFELSKSISQDEAAIKDTVIFVVSLKNTSRYALTNLLLEDELPSGYELLETELSHGSYDPPSGNWDIPLLQAGETAELRMHARVTAVDDYLNVVRFIDMDQLVSEDAVTSASAGLSKVHTTADLSISKSADTSQAEVGDIISFRLNLNNAGPDHATGVVIEDRVPVGFTVISAGQGGTINGNLIRWEIADMAPGDLELTYELEVNPPTGAEGEYVNIALISNSRQDDPDSDPDNQNGDEDDEDVWEITIPPANVHVAKSISKEEAALGDTVSFLVTIVNTGDYQVTGLVLEDLLPSGYELELHEESHGLYDPVTGLWEIAVLETGETAELYMEVQVAAVDDYLNTVLLTALDQELSDSAVTSASAGLGKLHAHADLSLTKTSDATSPEVGDIIRFRLRLANAGPDHATDVEVQDLVPSGFTIIDVHQGGIVEGNVIRWNIEELPVGEIELTYDLQVNAPTGEEGEYKNIARITRSDQTDPDSSPDPEENQDEDDEDTWEIQPPSGDLYIEKTVSQEEAAVGEVITFQVAATNTGLIELTNLVLWDKLPEGYLLHAITTTHGGYDEVQGLWSIPLLGTGETAVLTMEVEVTEVEDYVNIVLFREADQYIPETEHTTDEAAIDPKGVCLAVYNEFSPNQDGKNEVLWIDCIEEYPDNQLQVFDRWGNMVFEAHGYKNTWSGINQNPMAANGQRELPVGTYYYILKLGVADIPDKTGWIYISR